MKKIINLTESVYNLELIYATRDFLKLVSKKYYIKTEQKWPNTNRPPPVQPEHTTEVIRPPKQEEPKPKRPKKPKKFIVFLFVLTSLLLYTTFSNVTREVTEETQVIKTVKYNETLPDKISFKSYLENIYDVEGQEVEVKAFLKRYVKYTKDSEKAGVYVEGMTDDQNNTIDFVNTNSNLKKMFPQKGTSGEVYKITGTFKRKYKTLQLEPKKIELSQRDPAGIAIRENVVESKENITKNVTLPRFPIIRSFVFGLIGKEVQCEDETPLGNCSINKPYFCSYNGLVRQATKCGCPEIDRMYKSNCIKKVLCIDGTLEPECSKNKPKKCVDGELIDDVDSCGCPEDYKKIKDRCEKIKRCSDGTIYGQCSNKKPYFCTAGALVKDPDQCGCGSGYRQWKGDCIDDDKVEALEALDYINEIRKEYGRSELKWNDQLYELAMFRCKDMYDRKYFDHVTPDGKCLKDFKSDYGLGEYNIAENAGAVMYGYIGNDVDYASYASVISQVDGWMESRGHRYNLLYPSHIYGVATCYKGACVFLGANQEYYGLGFGPCTTGAQGIAYWNGVGTQSGET